MAGLLGLLGLGGQQPQAQTSMQPQSRGLLSNISDPLVALPLAGALMQPGGFGSNLGQGFAGAAVGLDARRKLQKEQLAENATANYLEAQGADKGLVELARSGAGAAALQQWSAMKKDDGLMAVGKNLYDKGSRQWIMGPGGPGGDDNEFYGTVIQGTDENGNPVAFQPSKSGVTKQLELPKGVQLNRGIERIDTGTGYIIKDRSSGANIGYEKKDVAGERAQQAIGTAQGEAAVNLPGVVANAEQSLAIIKDLKDDPNRQWATGKTSALNVLPGTGGYDYKQKVNQLKGKAFLEAYSGLKGTGAISEIEGVKAEQAVARLDTAQTEEGFMQALNDLEDVVTKGIARAKQKAAGGGGIPSPQGDGNNDPLGIR